MSTKKRIKSETNKAIDLCNDACVVCGWKRIDNNGESLLHGAHIKSFENIDEDSYDDIVALCPNCHTEYDHYLFYFSNDGKHKVIYQNDKYVFAPLFHKINYIKKEYLAYSEYIFKKENKLLF